MYLVVIPLVIIANIVLKAQNKDQKDKIFAILNLIKTVITGFTMMMMQFLTGSIGNLGNLKKYSLTTKFMSINLPVILL